MNLLVSALRLGERVVTCRVYDSKQNASQVLVDIRSMTYTWVLMNSSVGR